jgi:hypothetical protein
MSPDEAGCRVQGSPWGVLGVQVACPGLLGLQDTSLLLKQGLAKHGAAKAAALMGP